MGFRLLGSVYESASLTRPILPASSVTRFDAAVVARPDDKWGETPCAFVELKADQAASEDDLIAYCRDNMAHFKAPKTVVFTALPKTSTGKIQKFKLREKAKEL